MRMVRRIVRLLQPCLLSVAPAALLQWLTCVAACCDGGAASVACSGYGYGGGIRIDSPLGPVRLEYGWSDQKRGRFHVALGYD